MNILRKQYGETQLIYSKDLPYHRGYRGSTEKETILVFNNKMKDPLRLIVSPMIEFRPYNNNGNYKSKFSNLDIKMDIRFNILFITFFIEYGRSSHQLKTIEDANNLAKNFSTTNITLV